MAEAFKLKDRVSANNDVDQGDTRQLKRALIRLGFLEEPKHGVNGFVDTPLLGSIRSFQEGNGLRADGVVKPGGPTEGMIGMSLKQLRDGASRPVAESAETLPSPDPNNTSGEVLIVEGKTESDVERVTDGDSRQQEKSPAGAVPKRTATVELGIEKFSAAHDAVFAASRRYEDLYFSLTGEEELTVAIIEANGQFFFTTPTVGPGISDLRLTVVGEPEGAKFVGILHTHPPGADQIEFSIRDRKFVERTGIPMFLRNGAGEVRVLSRKGGEVGGVTGINICPGGRRCLSRHPNLK